jgi:hypothetical protein
LQRVRCDERRGRSGGEILRSDRGSHPEEEKPRMGAWRSVLSPVPIDPALVAESESPGSEGVFDGAGNRSRERLNGRRAPGRGNPVRLCGEGQPHEGKTLRGSGMKQARKVGDGANRRGRAKRRGRTVRSERVLRSLSGRRRLTSRRGCLQPDGRRSRCGCFGSQGPGCPQVSGRSMERSCSGEDDNARGSTNRRLHRRRGRRLETSGGSAGKPRTSPGPGTTQQVPVTSRRPQLRGAFESSREPDVAV